MRYADHVSGKSEGYDFDSPQTKVPSLRLAKEGEHVVEIIEEQYYSKDEGLRIESINNWEVVLSAIDRLLGAKIIDITFKIEQEEGIYLNELLIDLDNGSQIEFYQTTEGKTVIQSD